jgi:hypothetical protein
LGNAILSLPARTETAAANVATNAAVAMMATLDLVIGSSLLALSSLLAPSNTD